MRLLLARIGMIQSRLPLLQMVVAAAVFLWGAIGVSGFTAGPAIRANLVIASLLALASLGQTLVILIGGLDLAVPGYITVGAVAAVELGGTHNWPLPVDALCAALLVAPSAPCAVSSATVSARSPSSSPWGCTQSCSAGPLSSPAPISEAHRPPS